MTPKEKTVVPVRIPCGDKDLPEQVEAFTAEHPNAAPAGPVIADFGEGQGRLIEHDGFGVPLPEEAVWAWCREQIIADPQHAAKMMGIPEIANLRHMALPQAAIKLSDLIDVYNRENPSTDRSKREAIFVLNRLIAQTGARTLDDLTQEKLLAFRSEIEAWGNLQSAGTSTRFARRSAGGVFHARPCYGPKRLRPCGN